MVAKIGRMQYFLTISSLVYCKAVGITSGIMTRKIGSDTWTSMLFGFLAGSLIIMLMAYLGSKFPEKTVIQYSEQLLGKWFSRVVGLLLVFYFITSCAVSSIVIILHLKEYLLPATPFLVICAVYVALCLYGVYLGAENVFRFSLMGFLGILLINITMVVGTYKDFHLINLQPIMDRGIVANIVNSVYIYSDIAMATLAVGIIYPMLDSKKKSVGLSFWALVVGASMVIIWPIFETGVLGADVMKKYIVVCMQQVRCAQLTRYLPRSELLMVAFFSYGVFIQSVALFHCAKHSLKQVTGVKQDWYLLIPLTVVLSIITYYLGYDHNVYVNFLTYPWSQISTVLCFGLPIVLVFLALIRGKLRCQGGGRKTH